MKNTVLLTFVFFIVSMSSGFSHEGRAYLIFQHKKVGADYLSVRVDPDKGNGTFELFVEGNPAMEYQFDLKASPAADPAHVLSSAAVLYK